MVSFNCFKTSNVLWWGWINEIVLHSLIFWLFLQAVTESKTRCVKPQPHKTGEGNWCDQMWMLGLKVCYFQWGPRAQWLRVQAKGLTAGMGIRLFPFSRCLRLSVPQFPHLQNGYNKSIWWDGCGLNAIIFVRIDIGGNHQVSLTKIIAFFTLNCCLRKAEDWAKM